MREYFPLAWMTLGTDLDAISREMGVTDIDHADATWHDGNGGIYELRNDTDFDTDDVLGL